MNPPNAERLALLSSPHILEPMIEHSGTAKIREAVVSGIFYPEDAAELRSVVDDALGRASSKNHSAAAILTPHAGFEYSGDLTAAAWAAAAGRSLSAVIAIAPYHRATEAVIWLPEAEFYKTPLGEVAVDRRYVVELESCGTVFRQNDIPHFEEHGIEVQLPFLQVLFPGVPVVPILLGKPAPTAVDSLARALSLVFMEALDSVLIVVTSNFAGTASVPETAERFRRGLGYIAGGDAAALSEEYRGEEPEMCGAGCLTALLRSRLLAGLSWRLLGKGDSGSKRATPSEKVICYASGAWS